MTRNDWRVLAIAAYVAGTTQLALIGLASLVLGLWK